MTNYFQTLDLMEFLCKAVLCAKPTVKCTLQVAMWYTEISAWQLDAATRTIIVDGEASNSHGVSE